jgi:tRNA nucleotidyltransferase/poly(A) polymerase
LRICRIFRFAARTGGKIDDLTAEAISRDNRLRNISPEDDVSQERIWEEFKKAFSQAKDFRTYLNFIHKFDLWNEVFPGSVINDVNIVTKDLVCVLANLFIGEDTSKLEKKMVQSWRIETDLAKKVIFLIDLIKISPESAPDLFRQRIRSTISDENILEWLRVQDLSDEMFDVFMNFKPKIDSQELMSKGFKGKQLGDEIKRLEVEQFKSML